MIEEAISHETLGEIMLVQTPCSADKESCVCLRSFVFNRFGQGLHIVVLVMVADTTGTVQLTAWGFLAIFSCFREARRV